METENITTLPVFTVVERAVIYARVSKDDRMNEGRNLAGQLEMGRDYAQEKGYRIVEELSEDERGASGADIDLPQIKRVREMAYKNEFEVLIVRELDRLSRNLAKQLIIEEELRRAGVRIEYVLADFDDTPEGRFQKHIRATVAEYEREKIKERMVRGRRNKVKAGNILTPKGRCPYGYKRAKVDGKDVMVIDEKRANLVRLMFRWYAVGGLTMMEIAKRLNHMGAPLPNGIRTNTLGWIGTSVGKILENETYLGTWHYGKYNSRQRKHNPREHWIEVEVPVVVSDKLWRVAQERLRQNKEEAKRNRKANYLLSNRVTCGECGCKCAGRSQSNRRYYYCNSKNMQSRSRGCHLPHIRADHLDDIAWRWVKSKILDEDELERGFINFQARQEERNAPLREQLRITDNLLADNQAQLDRLLDLYLSGEFDKEMLVDRKERLEKVLSSLKKEKEGLTTQLVADWLTESEVRTIKDFTAIIRKEIASIEKENDFFTKRRLIELLDVRATVKVEEGQKVAYLEYKFDNKDNPVSIVPTTTNGSLRYRHVPFVFRVRLVLPNSTSRQANSQKM